MEKLTPRAMVCCEQPFEMNKKGHNWAQVMAHIMLLGALLFLVSFPAIAVADELTPPFQNHPSTNTQKQPDTRQDRFDPSKIDFKELEKSLEAGKDESAKMEEMLRMHERLSKVHREHENDVDRDKGHSTLPIVIVIALIFAAILTASIKQTNKSPNPVTSVNSGSRDSSLSSKNESTSRQDVQKPTLVVGPQIVSQADDEAGIREETLAMALLKSKDRKTELASATCPRCGNGRLELLHEQNEEIDYDHRCTYELVCDICKERTNISIFTYEAALGIIITQITINQVVRAKHVGVIDYSRMPPI